MQLSSSQKGPPIGRTNTLLRKCREKIAYAESHALTFSPRLFSLDNVATGW